MRTAKAILMKTWPIFPIFLLGGCLFVRDRVFEVKPDGTKVLVEDRVKVDPDSPVSSLPYGPIAVSIMGLGAAAYNEWKKRDIGKRYIATVNGIEAARLDADQIETIREAHKNAGVEKKVKNDLHEIRKLKESS